jgi:molybdate transport system regulatory protein
LLKQIEVYGSLNKAAKEMKMSYKAAWERLNSMNALASYPLVERTTGGKGGGGTILTPYAHEQIALFERFGELHREFMDRFAAAGDDPEKLAGIMSRSFLSTSARNQIPCKVKTIEIEEPKCTLTLAMDSQTELKATITKKSMMDMGIEIGSSVYAVIKSSDVKVGHLQHVKTNRVKLSNDLTGDVVEFKSYEESVELAMSIGQSIRIIAVVNKREISKLGLTNKAYISIDYDDILIGV